MKVNVKRKVGEINLQIREFLLPLFEVIVNSIHAIEESGSKVGEIRIDIQRDLSQGTLQNGFEASYPTITGFVIKDNGIGFTDKHFQAFNEEYADFKLAKGGKGVGRFTVLAAFSKMEVKSTFKNADDFFERDFTFDVENDVHESSEPILSNLRATGTTVNLNDYHPQFFEKTKVSQDHIAERIVEHCLIYYLNEIMPRCLLYDQDTQKTIQLDDIFKNYTDKDGNAKVVECGELKEIFKLDFIKEYRDWGANRIHLCGNNREAVVHKIHDWIPSLENPFSDSKGQYFISVYVTGKYLDDNIIETRNSFKFPDKSSDKDAFWRLSLEEIIDSVKSAIEEKYSDLISLITNETLCKIREYVYSGNGIEYKHLLNNPQNFRFISPNANHDQIDEELHKLDFKIQKQHRKKIEKLIELKRVHNINNFTKS